MIQTNLKSRLTTLDGLRALAALGVLWIHTWTLHHNPRLVVKGFDIASLMAIGGNGVDLFFVISGFCMYYFYAGNTQFKYADFWLFIKKRWVRLSPAFYTASAVYIAIRLVNDHSYPFIPSFLTSLVYANAFSPYSAESILWSLTPEWEFYIIIPFLLIYQRQFGFKKTFWAITLLLLAVGLIGVLLFKTGSDFLTNHIVFRYFEFMWGILVGKLLLTLPNYQLKNRLLCFLGFVVITYTGRVLLSQPVLALSSNYYNLFKLAGFTLMGAGFSGILYLALTSTKWLKLFLGNPVISFIGKISFSFYLWHGLIHHVVGNQVIAAFPKVDGFILPLITFSVSVVILIPLSTLSFYLLENTFMARHKQK